MYELILTYLRNALTDEQIQSFSHYNELRDYMVSQVPKLFIWDSFLKAALLDYEAYDFILEELKK